MLAQRRNSSQVLLRAFSTAHKLTEMTVVLEAAEANRLASASVSAASRTSSEFSSCWRECANSVADGWDRFVESRQTPSAVAEPWRGQQVART